MAQRTPAEVGEAFGLTISRTLPVESVDAVTEGIAYNVLETGRVALSGLQDPDEPIALHLAEGDVWVIQGATHAAVVEDGNLSVWGFPRVEEEETDSLSVSPPEEEDEEEFEESRSLTGRPGGSPDTLGNFIVVLPPMKHSQLGDVLAEVNAWGLWNLARGSLKPAERPLAVFKKSDRRKATEFAQGVLKTWSESEDSPNTMQENDMNVTETETAVIVFGEETLQLIPEGSDDGSFLAEASHLSDASSVRYATALLEAKADELGFEPELEFDDDLSEEEEQAAVIEATLDALEDIAAFLGDHIGLGTEESVLADVRAFDAAMEEGDLDGALRRAALIAATIGGPELEEAIQRMSHGARAKRARNAKKQTPEERQASRKAARRRKTGKYKQQAKRYAKKYRNRRAQLSASDEGVFDGDPMEEASTDDTYKASFAGRASTDDTLRQACMKHFKQSAGSSTLFGALKGTGSTYVGVKSTDGQMLRVLSRLVHEGLLAYESGKGYTATEALVELDLEDDES